MSQDETSQKLSERGVLFIGEENRRKKIEERKQKKENRRKKIEKRKQKKENRGKRIVELR